MHTILDAKVLDRNVTWCYVRAERSARLEQEGYDRVALPVVHGVYASGTR